MAKLDTTSAGLGEAVVKGAPVTVDLTLSPSQQNKQYLGEEAQEWLDRLRAEGEGMLNHTDSEDEGSEDFSGDEAEVEERKETTEEEKEKKSEHEAMMMEETRRKKLLEDADQEDLRRSEGEGMLYDAATLEDELTPMGERQLAKAEAPAPQKMDESAARAREALSRDEEDLRRSEGEGMLYYAATLEEEQTPRPGKFDTQAEKQAGERLSAPAEAKGERERERERESEIEKERSESEEVETKRESESEEEAYERLKREAEEEEKERVFQEEEAERLRQEEEEAEALRLKMARDWEELERQRAEAQAEEERKSRERVEELMRAAEEEEKRKQREVKEALKEREATEKLRREREIDQLVTRQSLDIENRRDQLRRTSAQRMGPVKWVPDHLVSACQSCQEPFTLTKRRVPPPPPFLEFLFKLERC
jgi:trichohyalin